MFLTLLIIIAFPLLLSAYWRGLYFLCFTKPSNFFRENTGIVFLHHHARGTVLFAIGLFTLVFFYLYWLGFKRFLFIIPDDTATYAQIFWYIPYKKYLYSTIHPLVFGENFLGLRSYYFAYLQWPFYLLKPHLLNLQAQQIVLLALGALPIYLMGKDFFKDNLLGLVFAFLYLSSFSIMQLALMDIDTEILAAPWLLFALASIYREKRLGLIISVLLALSVREEMCFIVLMMGFLAWWERKPRFFIIFPLAMALLYFFTVLLWLMPYIRGQAASLATSGIYLGARPMGVRGLPELNYQTIKEIGLYFFTPYHFLELGRTLLPLNIIAVVLAPQVLLPMLPILIRNLLRFPEVMIFVPKYYMAPMIFFVPGLMLAVKKWSAYGWGLKKLPTTVTPNRKAFFLAVFLLAANFNTHCLITAGSVFKILPPPIRGSLAGEPALPVKMIVNPIFLAERFKDKPLTKDRWDIVHRIPPQASVTVFDPMLLPMLAYRENICYAGPDNLRPEADMFQYHIIPVSKFAVAEDYNYRGFRFFYQNNSYIIYRKQ